MVRERLNQLSYLLHFIGVHDENEIVKLANSDERADGMADQRLSANGKKDLVLSGLHSIPTAGREDHYACGHGVDVSSDVNFRRTRLSGSMA